MMSVKLLVAVVLFAALVRAQPNNFLESVAIHNEVESVRCNSNMQNFSDYYSRLQKESRDRNEFEHYYPSAICFTQNKTFVGYIELDACCKQSHSNVFSGRYLNCSDYLSGKDVDLPIATIIHTGGIPCLRLGEDKSIPQSAFKWCIRIKSNRYDLHVCFNTSGVASYTTDAKKAGILDLVHVPMKRTLPYAFANFVRFSPITSDALVTCSVQTANYSAVRFMKLLLLTDFHISPLFSVPYGVKPFLRVGEEMKAFCGFSFALASSLFFKYVWKHNAKKLPMCQSEMNCTNSSRVEYTDPQEFINTEFQCKSLSPLSVVIKQVSLIIHSAQPGDVGEYTCSSVNKDFNLELKYIAGHVYVVYTEFPDLSTSVVGGLNHSFNCSFQAPKTARAYWIEEDRSRIVVNSTSPYATCKNHREAAMFTTMFTSVGNVDGFLHFTLLLHICNASSSHAGRYSCVVSDSNMTEDARLSFKLNHVEAPRTPTSTSSISVEMIIAIVVPIVLLIILLMFGLGVAMVAALAKKTIGVKERKATGDKEWIQLQKSKYEYPRKELILLRSLASGSFGQVYKAKADGIVKDDPTHNIVAVKTLKENFLPSERCDLLSELDLMKKIEPHPNICNFIAECTLPVDQPPCIIIEYASHGNLRELLVACREAMELVEHPIHLLTTEEKWSDAPKRYSTTDEEDPLSKEKEEHFQVLMCSDENPAYVTQRDYIASPGGIYNEDIVSFCQQILAGLCHLEKMKILHRDISARNILVAKGFCLKVSDFGFARDISEKEYYRKLTDGLIPVKWAALEALQQQIYTNKSDVWSFGVLVWEMASYGNAPYSTISLSYGWEDLISFLKEGHRLPVPSGCNNNLYNLMQQCWHADPEARASFSELQSQCQAQAGLM